MRTNVEQKVNVLLLAVFAEVTSFLVRVIARKSHVPERRGLRRINFRLSEV